MEDLNALAGGKTLRDLIKFPSAIDFRVIVDAEAEEALAVLKDTLSAIEPEGYQGVQGVPRPSRTGRYLSYTVRVKVQSPESLERIYAETGALSFVRHIL